MMGSCLDELILSSLLSCFSYHGLIVGLTPQSQEHPGPHMLKNQKVRQVQPGFGRVGLALAPLSGLSSLVPRTLYRLYPPHSILGLSVNCRGTTPPSQIGWETSELGACVLQTSCSQQMAATTAFLPAVPVHLPCSPPVNFAFCFWR